MGKNSFGTIFVSTNIYVSILYNCKLDNITIVNYLPLSKKEHL